MSEQNPKKMSVTQLTILTAINMMGSGIVMLPTKLAEIGTISILSWVITAFGSLALPMLSLNAGCSANDREWAAMPNMPSEKRAIF